MDTYAICPLGVTVVQYTQLHPQTGNRFVNPILSNRQELLSRSRFARDLENIVDLDFEGGLKMLLI